MFPLHDAADDRDEVPSTSSGHAVGRPSPTQQDADTGAAQAVRELKAENRRRGTPAQHQQTVSDAAQTEAAAAQDAEPPAGEAVPLQVSSIADHQWLICSINAAKFLVLIDPAKNPIWYRLERGESAPVDAEQLL